MSNLLEGAADAESGPVATTAIELARARVHDELRRWAGEKVWDLTPQLQTVAQVAGEYLTTGETVEIVVRAATEAGAKVTRSAYRRARRFATEALWTDWTPPDYAEEAAWETACVLAKHKFKESPDATGLKRIAEEVGRAVTGLGVERMAEAVVMAARLSDIQLGEGAFATAEAAVAGLERAKATAAELKTLDSPVADAPAAAPPPTSARSPFADLEPLPRVSYSLDMEVGEPEWLVKNLFVMPGTGCIYGESQTGKTFLLLHLAMCIAYGVPFFGRKVKQGGVVLVAAEAYKSMVRRLKKAEEELRSRLSEAGQSIPQRAPIEIVTRPPNLSREGNAMPLIRSVMAASEAVRAAGFELRLVAVDTLHASMGGGDEQSAADARYVVQPAQRMAEDHNAHFLFVHHTGKDSEKGARGSYAFKAAWDAEIELVVDGCGGPRAAKRSSAPRRGTTTKVRDGETGEQLTYALKRVVIGVDRDGDEISTCVVNELSPLGEPPHGALTAGSGKVMTAHAQAVLTIAQAKAEGRGSVNCDSVREEFFKVWSAGGRKHGTVKNAWSSATKTLVELGLVVIPAGANRIELVEPADWLPSVTVTRHDAL